MPKVVDHESRRADIVAAMWRVVLRDGIVAMSVRSIAAEAGLSPGALRHYFVSQAELLRFAVEVMTSQAEARVLRRVEHWQRTGGTDTLLAILEELVPLDAQRKGEFEVWLELVMYARTTPELRPQALEAHRIVRSLCRQAAMVVRGDFRDDATAERDPDVRRRADALHGLLDGLSLHLALYPGETSRARVRTALREHLEQLAV